MSNGAADDILKATNWARLLVTRLGMSDKIGPINVANPNKQFRSDSPQLSEKTIDLIDEEVKFFVSEALSEAEAIVLKNDAFLRAFTELLLAKETVGRVEAEELWNKTKSNY